MNIIYDIFQHKVEWTPHFTQVTEIVHISYASLTTVYNNLKHQLTIVTESFSPLNLNYTTSFVKVQTRSDVASHVISDSVYLPCALNWYQLVSAGSRPKLNADVIC